ncbi:MAG: hypothetical protein WBZ36_01255 [Candidatus Nitrosopolaris sp.]
MPRTNFFNLSLSILEMGRPSYVCATCSEHFTRKYSATRHNHNLHNGAAEIVRLIDYLAGRSSGQYTPNNPFWYKHNNPYHNFGGTVADSAGNNFQPAYLPQQEPPQILQNFANPLYRPPPRMDDQRYDTNLSPDIIPKIGELKRLVNKYPQYRTNPDGIIRLAIYDSINGNNTLLDSKLEQLRTIDSLAKY